MKFNKLISSIFTLLGTIVALLQSWIDLLAAQTDTMKEKSEAPELTYDEWLAAQKVKYNVKPDS